MIKSGDKLRVIKPFDTFATFRINKYYDVGDILEVLEPTGQDPWGTQDPKGHWLVKCPFWHPPQPQAVWSASYGLEYMVAYGYAEIMNRVA